MNSAPEAYEIRQATPADAECLSAFGWRVFTQAFLEDLGCVYPQADLAHFRREAYAPEAFARWTEAQAYGVWLAETGGAPLGYAVIGPCSFDHPWRAPNTAS